LAIEEDKRAEYFTPSYEGGHNAANQSERIHYRHEGKRDLRTESSLP